MNKSVLLVSSTFCIVVLFSFHFFPAESSNEEVSLGLRIFSSKASYKLGETNIFTFQLGNSGDKIISFVNSFQVKAGYIQIFVSKGSEGFKRYIGPGWGKGDVGYKLLTLKPNENISIASPIFWNRKPEVLESAPLAVKARATEGKILSYYCFSEPGQYKIKASYSVNFVGKSEPTVIESMPIEVTIEEPTPSDLEIWNKIKNSGELAYFIQESDINIPTYKPQERVRIEQLIEQIIADYPESFYSERLRENLALFHAKEEKRKLIREKKSFF